MALAKVLSCAVIGLDGELNEHGRPTFLSRRALTDAGWCVSCNVAAGG